MVLKRLAAPLLALQFDQRQNGSVTSDKTTAKIVYAPNPVCTQHEHQPPPQSAANNASVCKCVFHLIVRAPAGLGM